MGVQHVHRVLRFAAVRRQCRVVGDGQVVAVAIVEHDGGVDVLREEAGQRVGHGGAVAPADEAHRLDRVTRLHRLNGRPDIPVSDWKST
eukprot:274477-Pleurochrysis_carterae.AAC.1